MVKQIKREILKTKKTVDLNRKKRSKEKPSNLEEANKALYEIA